ncbi:hypothetical protein HaLaN_01752 [Haematococcus lacustris]|uniref:Uncharacterized protein n=1 Tax=Haematococcus lacustris TaxID=44745 RepID=A0A699YAC8_HAELA|nr:hypothetical protein HaLaN_01752 [Haematococcus lacustris]
MELGGHAAAAAGSSDTLDGYMRVTYLLEVLEVLEVKTQAFPGS